MHSKKYEKVKSYYLAGYWTASMVQNAVIKGWITQAEADEIISIDHEQS